MPVIDVDQVDYLFHRLFAMIQLMLKKEQHAVSEISICHLCGKPNKRLTLIDKNGNTMHISKPSLVNYRNFANTKLLFHQGLSPYAGRAGTKQVLR